MAPQAEYADLPPGVGFEPKDEPLFMLELVYAGTVSIGEVPQEAYGPLLFIETPRLLFPFARAVVANATREAGFPPLNIAPVDFVALYRQQLEANAVFSLFVRRLPERRNYLLACGIEDTLRCLESVEFTAAGIEYLDTIGIFRRDFLDWLARYRFDGAVFAVREGTPIFAEEPILEVSAPIAEAQLLETLIMNQVQLQTMLASKAARVVTAADGRAVVDFGLRRIHGLDAGLKSARAFAIAGVAATSNVLAGSVYGLRLSGTMAHSFIQAFEHELEAVKQSAYPPRGEGEEG